jgi:hypothetical protein
MHMVSSRIEFGKIARDWILIDSNDLGASSSKCYGIRSRSRADIQHLRLVGKVSGRFQGAPIIACLFQESFGPKPMFGIWEFLSR